MKSIETHVRAFLPLNISAVGSVYYVHFPLFYQSKLKTTQKSHKKEPEVYKVQTSKPVQTSPNLRFCLKKKPTPGLYYKDFGILN